MGCGEGDGCGESMLVGDASQGTVNPDLSFTARDGEAF